MAKKGSRKSGNGWIWGVAVVAAVLVGFSAWYLWPRPEKQIAGVQTFPEEGRDHVNPPAEPAYKTDPPTSGPHYPFWTKPGFYKEPQARGALVHALEHGNIVIYYDLQNTPADVVRQLESYARQYTGQWDGVVVTPRQQPEQVVLTAWRRMLVQPTFDAKAAEAFMDAYRGRGPENPVR